MSQEAPNPPLLRPIRHVVRLTVEAVTPLSISSGEADAELDAPLFRDWNGFPCLSGAATAGVLRSLYLDHFREPEAKALFGFVEPRTQNGEASRLLISFGLVHDENDRVVDAYRLPDDPVLKLLVGDAPLLRDHVAIDERGVAEDHMKFDRASCPIGTRFSLELAIDGDEATEEADKASLFNAARMFEVSYARFGGAGRRGLGRLKIVRDGNDDSKIPRAFYAAVDRRGSGGRMRWLEYRKARLDQSPAGAGFKCLSESDLKLPASSRRVPVEGAICLDAKFLWRIGQGGEPWLQSGTKRPDISPPKEITIAWKGGKADVEWRPAATVPGSSVKGALAHRTKFHLRRLCTEFAGSSTGESDDAFAQLFGSIRGANGGSIGAVLIDDVMMDLGGSIKPEERAGRRTRNSIDRHTGGVRMGKLFTDEAVWRGSKLVIPFVVLANVPPGDDKGATLVPISEDAVKALSWALDDLCQGRLALGARDGTGDGVFAGSVEWNARKPDGSPLTLVDAVRDARGRAERDKALKREAA